LNLTGPYPTLATQRGTGYLTAWLILGFANIIVRQYTPTGGTTMNVDRIVLAFAGAVILVSLALAHYHNANWMWLTAFVGANLLQSSFTGFCPLAKILKGLGSKPGAAFD
jgi:hypothetical protein